MKQLILMLGLVCLSIPSLAGFSISDGTVYIGASGGDGSSAGDDGGDGGTVELHLSYADAAKTQVLLTGTTWKTKTFRQVVMLKDLKRIEITAVGGDGVAGYNGMDGSSGSSGSDGWDGSNGWDGCPPGNGGNGTDGGDGRDGGDGWNGGPGGSGGSGGSIRIIVPDDQSELLMFVRTDTSGGSGAAGGWGGAAGRGGSGGRGGRGGRGGQNTCKDANGNPTHGPDGRDGWSGHDGRSGRDGSSGSPGRSGYGGGDGSRSFTLETPSGLQTFEDRFRLKVTALKFVDESGDSVLQPGERAYLVGLEITNTGPMPSPRGQVVQLGLASTSTLLSPTVLSAKVGEISAGEKRQLSLAKGALTLQVPNQRSLIGKKAVASGLLSINGVQQSLELETGMAVAWPLTVSSQNDGLSAKFEVPIQNLKYSLKNVGTTLIGQGGAQPLYVQMSWVSKSLPGSDVVLAMADGRFFNLAQPVTIADLSVAGSSTVGLPFSVVFRNSRNLSAAQGNLILSLRLQDPGLAGNDVDVVQTISTSVDVNLVIEAIEWNQTLNFAYARIQCQFPQLPNQVQTVALMHIQKDKGSSVMQVQLELPGSAASATSPVISVSAAKAMPFLQSFRSGIQPAVAVDFLNKLVGPSSPKGPWSFQACTILP